MARYIDADKLPIKVWNGDFVGVSKNDIEQTPTEEVIPIIRGKWKANNYGEHYCSNCGISALNDDDCFEKLSNYCPFCGAKMTNCCNLL